MPFMIEINKLQNRLEDIKEKVSKNQILPYFAKDNIETLLQTEKKLKTIFEEIKTDKQHVRKISYLIKETEQYLQDLDDIIEFEKGKSL